MIDGEFDQAEKLLREALAMYQRGGTAGTEEQIRKELANIATRGFKYDEGPAGEAFRQACTTMQMMEGSRYR